MPFTFLQQPSVAVDVTNDDVAMDEGASAGPLRAKRKNAGTNRRYSDEDYVVEEVEIEAAMRSKRRKTSVVADVKVDAGAHPAAWIARAPNGPINDQLLEAMHFFRYELDNIEASSVEDLLAIGNEAFTVNSNVDSVTDIGGTGADASCDCIDDGLSSAMELD